MFRVSTSTHVATVTDEQLTGTRTNPWGDREETVRSCLHTILQEEWEHHRYAVRDLDAQDQLRG